MLEKGLQHLLNKEEQEIFELLKKDKFGFTYRNRKKYIGSGCDRAVFKLSDRYVIKFEQYINELYGSVNKKEYDFYQSHKNTHLAKPYWISKNHELLLMEHIEVNGIDEEEEAEAIRFLRRNIDNCEPVDVAYFNVGTREDGSYVCFDYAEFMDL